MSSIQLVKIKKAIVIILLSVSIPIAIYFCFQNKKLAREVEILKTDDAGFSRLNVQVLLEALVQQKPNKQLVLQMFTFDGKCLLLPSDERCFLWKSFDVNSIDMQYNKSYNEILELKNLDLFLLFRDGYLVDYRCKFSDREFLMGFLKAGGEIEAHD